MKRKLYLFIPVILFLSTGAKAQFAINKQVKPYFGKAAIKKKVSDLKANTVAKTGIGKQLDSTAIKPYRSYFKRFKDRTGKIMPSSSALAQKPARGSASPLLPYTTSSSNANTAGPAQEIWSNFLAIDFYDNPVTWPPDPNGAVSESQVIVTTNLGIKVFEKTLVTEPPTVTSQSYSRDMPSSELFLSLEQLFSPVLPFGSYVGDPHIRYDRLSKRWFIVAIEINPSEENNLILLAVSDGERVTDQSSFLFYSFNSSLFPYDPKAPYAPFLDYPTLGIDKHSVLIGGNQFGWDSLTNVGYVIDKTKLIHGELSLYPFELGVVSFVSSRFGGLYTPQGVHNDDGNSTQSVFAGLGYFQDQVGLAKFGYNTKHQPWFAAEIFIPVEQFNLPRDISSPGGLTRIDPLDSRLLAAEIHKNKLTGKSSLWTAHAIGVNQSGHFMTGSDSDLVKESRTGARWYEIGNIYTQQPALNQVGTLFDAAQISGRRAVQYFNPSIAANGQGHSVLSGTTTAYNQYLNVFAAGRFYGDPAGALHDPVKATQTTAIYAPYIDYGGFHLYIDRWGDFSQTVVDPDDQTIWTFQEYANVDDSYGVRAVQLKAPPPATPLPFAPVGNKIDATITVEGVSVDNSGFFDPGKDIGGPGYNKLTVKSTGNILVSNLKFVDPTKITFTLGVKGKPAGNYSLVITNPDGQFVILNYVVQAVDPTVAHRVNSAAPKKPEAKMVFTTKVVPNPAKDNTNILINALNSHAGKIILLDLTGKQIFEKSYQFVKGENYALIPLSNLSNGTYIAAIYNSDNVLQATQKIIKQ